MRIRLFLHVFTTEARRMMSYRVDFWLNAVVGLIAGIVIPYFLWRAIFDASPNEEIGGYTLSGMVLYYILAALLGRVIQGPDLALTLANDIYQGELSRYLVYPTSYALFKYAQHLGAHFPGLVQITVFGTLFALTLDFPSEITVTTWAVVRCAVSVAVANLLAFLLTYPVQTVAFWADNVWSLSVLMRFVGSLLGGLFLPLSLFPTWSHTLLSWLPFPYLFSYPVNTLLGKISPQEWAQGILIALCWCGVLILFGRALWRRGELTYSGVGI